MIKNKHDDLRRFLYTPIEEAIELLEARQKQDLKTLDIDVPEFLLAHYQGVYKIPVRNTAIIFRQIATPNYEMHRVSALCDKYNLNLLIFTINEDKFCTANTCKYALGRMGFFEGLDRRGSKKIRYRAIIKFAQYDGQLLRECKTCRGQSFVEFHHALLLKELTQLNHDNITDCSKWFLKQRDLTENWYLELLKPFLKHAILFETFMLSGRELDFTLTKVLPAFQEMIDTFGIKPLIVRSDTEEMEGDDYWQLYPAHLYDLVPYDRRKTPRYDAPFDQFSPSKIRKSK